MVLVFTRIGPDMVLVAAMTLLLALGVLSPAQALEGLSNPALATVGVVYVVAAGLIDTGVVHTIGQRFLGVPGSLRSAQARIMLPAVALSAFLNNTPVVAMLVPAVQDWARKHRLSVSKLMIPLSYAAILGGSCTVIGTSTNLIVSGLVDSRGDMPGVGFFEIAWIGLPCALIGVAYVLLASPWLLPERRPAIRVHQDPREYALEMVVEPGSPLVGRSIEQAGLRHLPGVFLAEIERADTLLPAVPPTERLQGDDRLVFVGSVDSVVDLYKIKGLIPAPDQVFKLDSPRPERLLIEAVVSSTSPLVGHTIRDSRFRSRYDAVVVAVARGGRRIAGRIGDIELNPGDTLLVEGRPSFVEQQRLSRDFMLVSAVEDSSPPRHERGAVAVAILGGMVALVTLFDVPMLVAALIAAALMLLSGCTNGAQARRSLDWQVLIVIGASLALGRALDVTGAAAFIAAAWIDVGGGSPWLALAAVYLMTSLLTAFITNNGAAVLMFPLAEAAAAGLEVGLRPFVMTIMVAASASFATPISYQTNMMVYGPGGYRFSDYLRIGLPLNCLLGLATVLIAPVVWPF
ncbi:MAG: SLC13 family permease [Chromatiales bacterium]|jgi:di/tricarboxylate transporter